jgi:neutral ceramidase
MFPTCSPIRWLCTVFVLLGSARGGDLRVGAAQVEITPAAGTPMGGYYKFRAVEGVRDPLYVKTIVVEQEGARAAFIVLDLSGTTRTLVAAARQQIERECGLAGYRVMISATHTHSGPQLPRGSMMDDITKATSPPGQAFVGALPGLIARSVSEAIAKLAPAKAAATVAKTEGVTFNRRVLDQDGKCLWQPQKIDPATQRPAGPVDPDLGLLVFDPIEPRPAPIAAYVNFAMHPTSVGSGLRVSADYPGVLTRLLRERKGMEMIAVFANGTCGDLNHTDYFTGRRRTTEELGTVLADAATEAWPRLQPLRTFAPRARSITVTLPRRPVTDAEIEKARDVARRMLTENLGTVPMAEAVCILETVAKKEVPLEAEVQTIVLGEEVAIVSLPGEIFVELGLSLKAASPFRHTFLAELANGSIGYVPHRAAYPQGNYEVVSARCAEGSGELLVEAALQSLRDLAKP